MEGLAVAAALMIRMDEQGPDAARGIAGRKGNNLTLCLDDPGATEVFHRRDVVGRGDAGRVGQGVLAHGQAHAMHGRNIRTLGQPQVHRFDVAPGFFLRVVPALGFDDLAAEAVVVLTFGAGSASAVARTIAAAASASSSCASIR